MKGKMWYVVDKESQTLIKIIVDNDAEATGFPTKDDLWKAMLCEIHDNEEIRKIEFEY